MSVPLKEIVAVTLVPVGAAIAGGLMAVLRAPGEQLRSIIQHFAAGVVLAAVAGELLPEITKEHRPLGVVIGFSIGVALMIGVKMFAERLENAGEATGKGKVGLLVAVGVDVLVDGLLIGVGFAAGARVGQLLVIALTLELLFLGLSVAASLNNAGWPRGRSLLSVVGLSSLALVGASLGGYLLSGLSGLALEIVLSFGAAALMYLVVEELLTEAHEVKETPLITASFFTGFVALYLLEILR